MVAGNSSDGVEVHGLCLDWLNVEIDPAKESVEFLIGFTQLSTVGGDCVADHGEEVVVHICKEVASRVVVLLDDNTCKNSGKNG